MDVALVGQSICCCCGCYINSDRNKESSCSIQHSINWRAICRWRKSNSRCTGATASFYHRSQEPTQDSSLSVGAMHGKQGYPTQCSHVYFSGHSIYLSFRKAGQLHCYRALQVWGLIYGPVAVDIRVLCQHGDLLSYHNQQVMPHLWAFNIKLLGQI